MAEQIYTEGKIIEYSWGYEQTNIDYYLIVKRTPTTVTLQKIGKKNVTTNGFMSGRCEPDPSNILDKKPIRRKVHKDKAGDEIGVAVGDYGWGDLWNGRPSHWTGYA